MRIPRGACPHWLIRTPLSTLVTSDRVKQCSSPQHLITSKQFGPVSGLQRDTSEIPNMSTVATSSCQAEDATARFAACKLIKYCLG